MIKKSLYCLTPLGVLLLAITLACILGYLVLLAIGDVVTLERLVNKTTQVFLVLSIFPLRKVLQLSWRDIGFNGKNTFFAQLWQGAAVGLATLGPVILFLYVLDIRVLDVYKIWTVSAVLETIFVSLLAAFAISFLEEPVFRGVLLAGLERRLGLWISIVVSACYYGILHFLKTDLEVPYQELTWYSGFVLAFDAFGNLFNPVNFPAFLALVMVGIFLGVARLKAGLGLGFCVGCHAAWVLLIKITKSITNRNYESEYFYLVSLYDGVIGPLVTGWLLLVVLLYLFYSRSCAAGQVNSGSGKLS